MLTAAHMDILLGEYPNAILYDGYIRIPCDASYSHPNDSERPIFVAQKMQDNLISLGFHATDISMEPDSFCAKLSIIPAPVTLDF